MLDKITKIINKQKGEMIAKDLNIYCLNQTDLWTCIKFNLNEKHHNQLKNKILKEWGKTPFKSYSNFNFYYEKDFIEIICIINICCLDMNAKNVFAIYKKIGSILKEFEGQK